MAEYFTPPKIRRKEEPKEPTTEEQPAAEQPQENSQQDLQQKIVEVTNIIKSQEDPDAIGRSISEYLMLECCQDRVMLLHKLETFRHHILKHDFGNEIETREWEN